MIRNTPKQHIHMNAMKNARNQQKKCQTSVKKTSTLSRPALPYGNAHLEIKNHTNKKISRKIFYYTFVARFSSILKNINSTRTENKIKMKKFIYLLLVLILNFFSIFFSCTEFEIIFLRHVTYDCQILMLD